MGELMRRYWHPVGLVSHATDTPREVGALGEDLVLFRDKSGWPGLLRARCCHRGTTLYCGNVEERGIRCCYHGWLFDAEGHCLDGDPQILPCNWLQHFENVVDLYHVVVLHGTHSGPQFSEMMALLPDEVHFERTPLGVRSWSKRRLPDGGTMRGSAELAMPALRVVPNPRAGVAGASLFGRAESIGWTLPIDDTHFRIYVAGPVRETGELRRMRLRQRGKLWEHLTSEAHRAFPGDFEAQTGQGAITFHSDEHLTETDRGVALVRHFLRQQLERLAQGQDPVGTSFDEQAPPVVFAASRELQAAEQEQDR